ncbi:MAG TPA: MmgE/PrpD family protein [Burkholderiales bacterium]|jgi:2-methylcitrate dehydratase PrpD|nr:MmgE/PrpD family protein [Burkholderiales bacterium]
MGADREASGREAGLNPFPTTETLSRFLAESRWEGIPAAIRHEGKRGLLNALGCILAGREDPAVAIVRRVFPLEDALIDAAAATAHDYDDTHLPTVIHATPPVAAAVLSIARKQKVSGAELLHAFVLGVETTCRMGNAVMPGHYERGWHITSTCGVFGATAAAAKLLRLDERQVASALGLAATQASGLVEMLGSMARVLNAGFAARNGLAAARLASEGFEGPRAPIEGLRGFVNVFGGSADLSQITRRLGEHWEMKQVAYKPYPSGVVLHALIDACLEHGEKLRHALETGDGIQVELHPLAIERTNRPEPRNAIEARLSAQHAVAVALLHGDAGLEQFSDAAALDPEVQALRRRIGVAAEPSLDKMAARIRLAAASVEAPAARTLDDARLEAKFARLGGAQAARILETIRSLETQQHVSLL